MKEIWETIKLFFKKIYYHTLTEENLDKIIKRKEEEYKEIELLEQQVMEEEREELRGDLELEGWEGEDLDDKLDEILGTQGADHVNKREHNLLR